MIGIMPAASTMKTGARDMMIGAMPPPGTNIIPNPVPQGDATIMPVQNTAMPTQIGAFPAAPFTPTPFEQTPMPIVQPGQQVPATGLIGAEQALSGGVAQARTDIGGAMSGIDQNPAAKLQADLTGANGPEAQQLAQQQMQSSPAMAYQMEQMQRATERSAAARGGLMGGNVLQELQRNAAGIASQDYQNQFANIGQVADRKLMQDQLKSGLSRDLAETALSAGIQTAGMRTQAGRDIAQNASSAASQISSLLTQRGVVLSDMMAKDISTVTDMIYQSGLQDSLNSQNLAAILANIAGGQASIVAQGNANIGAANAAGTIGVGNAIQYGIQQGIGAFGGGGQQNMQQVNNSAGYSWSGNQDPFSTP